MIQGDGGNAKWARVQTVEGGPVTDYTTLGQCQGMNTPKHKSRIQTDNVLLSFPFFNHRTVGDETP